MEEKLDQVKKLLEKHNQTHLLINYENLSDEKKEILLDQILTIDFEEMEDLYAQTKQKIELGDSEIEPVEAVKKSKLTNEEKLKYQEIGNKIMHEGKYAVVTMAGGQGTRLRT